MKLNASNKKQHNCENSSTNPNCFSKKSFKVADILLGVFRNYSHFSLSLKLVKHKVIFGRIIFSEKKWITKQRVLLSKTLRFLGQNVRFCPRKI